MRLTSFPGRHEGYYISKANQTVRSASGKQFDFLVEELINVEYSHKACPNLSRPVSSTHNWSSSANRTPSCCSQTQTFVRSNVGWTPLLDTRYGFSRDRRSYSLPSNRSTELLPRIRSPSPPSPSGKPSGLHGTRSRWE